MSDILDVKRKLAERDPCLIGGCNKRAINSRGWCSPHYQRWRRHGHPLAGRPSGADGSEIRRFLKQAIECRCEDCLIWPYTKSGNGYGQVYVGGKMKSVHRLVCEHRHGPAPSAKHHAAHNCGNRICCNPSHIRWATPSENNLDKILHGTDQRGERNGFAKLNNATVRECRRLVGRVPLRKLAKLYGVSDTAVYLAVAGKTWRDV